MQTTHRHSVAIWGVALVLGVAGLFGTGCESASDAAAAIVLPPRKEEELGDEVEKDFLEKENVQLYKGDEVNNYIQKLGNKAKAQSDTPDAIEYEFKVIDNPDQVNAFAMPGGQIYFYTGLLKEADTEAEVMAVMCHEVAHVSERHIAKKLTAAYGFQALSQAALGNNAGVVADIATQLATKGTLIQFGRKMESEADEVGFKYDVDAGYDPHGFISFFQKIKQMSGAQPPVWLSSHPLPQSRIDAAEKRIGGRSFDGARVGKEAHQKIVEAIESYSGGGGGSTGGSDASSSGDASNLVDAGM